MTFLGWWVALFIAGLAVLYFGANALQPGPVVSLIAGALWTYIAPLAALAIAEGRDGR